MTRLLPLIEQNNFASGVQDEDIHARGNLARVATGVTYAENMIVTANAILTRRPGTRFLRALKTEGQRGKNIPFRFSATDRYMLLFNGGAMRVKRNGGYVLSAGNPYELAIPYAAADLPNLRWWREGNALFLVCEGHEPRVLTRVAHDNWTLAPYRPKGGPVGDQNLDEGIRIAVSGVRGSVSLAGIGTNFQTAHVGTLWRLDESDLSLIPTWKADEDVDPGFVEITGTAIGDMTGLNSAFDSDPATAATKTSSASCYIGVTPGSAKDIFCVEIRPDKHGIASSLSALALVTVALYAKTGAAPANGTDGTKIAEFSFYDVYDSGPTKPITVFAFNPNPDTSILYDHLWAYFSGVTAAWRLPKILFNRLGDNKKALYRRWQGRVYEALTAGKAGLVAPTHDEGSVLAEDGGVIWAYRHRDRGYVRITAVADATHATADVVEVLPFSLMQLPTYRFFPPAWSSLDGWPSRIGMVDGTLVFTRGPQFWRAKPSDLFAIEESGVAGDVNTALSLKLKAIEGSLPDIEWVMASAALVFGCKDNEIVVRAASMFDTLTVDNARRDPRGSEGSAPHVPARVDGGALFIGRDRGRIHFAKFDSLSEALDIDEVSKTARSLLDGKAEGLAWHRDPHRICWCWCQNGAWVGLTFDLKEKIIALHAHPMDGAVVEDIAVLPADDQGAAEVHLIVSRTINGSPRRYDEMLTPFFKPLDRRNPTAEGAWFVDCALRYQGAPVTTLTGLGHLEGETVGVHANGKTLGRRQVVGAQIPVEEPVTDAIVGVPQRWFVQSLPLEIANERGASTRGQEKRATHVFVDVLHSAGGKMSANGGTLESLYDAGDPSYTGPVKLRTGLVHHAVDCPSDTQLVLAFEGDDTMPMTIRAFGNWLDAKGG